MQVLKTFRINLDLKRVTAQAEKIPPLVVGDNGNILEITLTDSGEPVNLEGCRVVAVFSTSDGQPVEQDTEGNGVAITGEKMNVLVIDLKTTSYSVGKNNCEIQIYSGENLGTLVTTANFNFDGRPGILNDETIQAEDKFPILTALIERVENLATATGDMTKEEYDPDGDGVVERAEEAENAKMLGGKYPEQFAERFHAAQHYKGGADQITPKDIGALPEATTPADIGAASLDQNGKVTANQASSAYLNITGDTELSNIHEGKTLKVTAHATLALGALTDGCEVEIINYGANTVTLSGTLYVAGEGSAASCTVNENSIVACKYMDAVWFVAGGVSV